MSRGAPRGKILTFELREDIDEAANRITTVPLAVADAALLSSGMVPAYTHRLVQVPMCEYVVLGSKEPITRTLTHRVY